MKFIKNLLEKDCFRFEFYNNIPFSRGLEVAQPLLWVRLQVRMGINFGVKASKETILNKAIIYEAHPDNIAPAVWRIYQLRCREWKS